MMEPDGRFQAADESQPGQDVENLGRKIGFQLLTGSDGWVGGSVRVNSLEHSFSLKHSLDSCPIFN